MKRPHSQGFLALVGEAKQRIAQTTIFEVRERMDAGALFHLIDVREDHEWALARLPQAQHMARGILERDIEHSIPEKDALIILYCGGGYRSALAADNLQKMGYTNVLSMAGGFGEWKESGFPLDS